MFYKSFLLKGLFLCLLLLIVVPTLQGQTDAEKKKSVDYIRSMMLQGLYYNAEPKAEVLGLGQTKVIVNEKSRAIYNGKNLQNMDLNSVHAFFASGTYKNINKDNIVDYQHKLVVLAFIYHGIEKFYLPRFKFKNVESAKKRKGNKDVRKLILEGIKLILSEKHRPGHAYHVTYSYHYYPKYTTTTISAVATLLFDEFNKKNDNMDLIEKKEFAEVFKKIKDYCRILGYGGVQITGANWAIRGSFNALLYLSAVSQVEEMEAFMKQHDISMRRLNDEGVTYDYGFFHHTYCNYWGKYGIHYFKLTADLAMLLEATPWKFSTWKKRFLRNCLLDGFGPLVYRGNILALEGGKASLTGGITKAYSSQYLKPVEKLIKLWGIDEFGGSRKDEVLAYINNFDSSADHKPEDSKLIESENHKVYWYSAKQVHRRKNYAVLVGRLNKWVGSPEREQRVQPDLSFATSSYYAFGYTSFLTKGPEHTHARAAWDFTTLPGTTVAIGMRGIYKLKQNIETKVPYSGGVSDGMYGVGGFICDAGNKGNNRRHPVVSTKGNFFFDDEIVMLGQSISRKYDVFEPYPSPPWSDNSDNPVWTTIDQTDARTSLTYNLGDNSATKVIPKISNSDQGTSLKIKTKGDVAWFHHDDKGYLILGKNKAIVLEMKNFPVYEARFSLGSYTGALVALGDQTPPRKLKNLGRSIKKKLIKKYGRKKLNGFATINSPELKVIRQLPLIRLAIDHGKKPKNESYDYVLLPNVTAKQVENYAKNLPFNIIINKKGIQAVVHKNLNMAQVLFYKNGGNIKFKLGGKNIELKASTYSAILLARDKNNEKAYRISVSEPTYLASSLKVTIKGLAFSLDTKKTKKKAAIATKVKGNDKSQMTSISFKLSKKNITDKSITAHLILL